MDQSADVEFFLLQLFLSHFVYLYLISCHLCLTFSRH